MDTERKGRERTKRKGEGGGVRVKPKKPYPDFPLFPHATHRWAKKIRGRFAFFGPWEDPHAALARYLDQRDDLYAGRVPRSEPRRPTPNGANGTAHPPPLTGPTVRDLVNHFLTAKQRRLEAGDIGRRAFSDYHAACRHIIDAFGPHRFLADLRPEDFGLFRARLAKTRGPVALGNQVNRARSVFKYAHDADLIERPIRFGPEFVRPAMRTLRLDRQARGKRLFERDEIRALLDAAGPALRAMIYLGINCALGNSDVAHLPLVAVDLDKGILDFPRPKTGIARRGMLWPETVRAIRAYLKTRRDPVADSDHGILFTTKYGQRWVRVQAPGKRTKGQSQAVLVDGVCLQFRKLMRATGVYRTGRSFYALRHTFRTVADELGDRRAVDLCMGHESAADIATHYVRRVGDERLRRVAWHVRGWRAGRSRRGEPRPEWRQSHRQRPSTSSSR